MVTFLKRYLIKTVGRNHGTNVSWHGKTKVIGNQRYVPLMIPEKSDKIHVGLIIAFSSSNMDLCKYQNSPHALCLRLHHLLLFLSPLLPDRAVMYTAQSSDSFPLLYETVFIPWDIWTEKSDLESGHMSLMSPLSSLLCKAVFVLRDL